MALSLRVYVKNKEHSLQKHVDQGYVNNLRASIRSFPLNNEMRREMVICEIDQKYFCCCCQISKSRIEHLKSRFFEKRVLCFIVDHHTVVFIMKLLSAYYLRQFRLWPRKLDKSPSPQTSNPSTKLRPWAMQYCNIQFVRGPFSDSLITNCSKFTANQPANGFDGEKCEKSNMSEAESCQNLNLVGKHVKPRVSKVCALRNISIKISCLFWKRNCVGRKHAIKIDNTDES